MHTNRSAALPGASIFDAPGQDVQLAIAHALAEIDGIAIRYRESSDLLDGIALLDEIEGLRRFVLVRAALAETLSRPRRQDAPPMGRQLCEALFEMIGDVPALVKSCTREGAYGMERDTRRAIACLNFLGSLDHRFI